MDRLSSEILNEFDLFVIDQESIDALSINEKAVLEESVKQGLGLLIFYQTKDKIKNSTFLSLSMRDLNADTVRMNLGSSVLTFSALPLKVIDVVEPVTQTSDRVLSGFVNKGAGRMAFQFLQETYRLVLEGKKMEYALLWSPLVERAARTQNPKFKVEIERPFPIYPDEPLDVSVIAANATPRLKNDGTLIPLREDVVIDDYWQGTTWAGKNGWHQFAFEHDSTKHNYFVSSPGEWQSLHISQLHKSNESLSQKLSTSNNSLSIIKQRQPISLLVFFIIFLLSAGFLWLVPKL